MLRGMEKAIRRARDERLAKTLRKRRSARRQMLSYLRQQDCLVLAERSDHRLFLDPADTFVTEQVISQGSWHRKKTEACFDLLASEGLLTPGGVFVDIGANIGTQTIYALLSPHFDRAAAFEPDPGNFEMLARNIALNNMENQTQLHQVGLGETNETLTLSHNPSNLGAHTLLDHAPQAGATIEVSVRRAGEMLTDAALGGKPGLIWIDVEGFEPQVMSGLAGVLAVDTPVCMEFSPKYYGADKTADFAKALKAMFAQVRAVPGERVEINTFEDLIKVEGQIDIILTGART